MVDAEACELAEGVAEENEVLVVLAHLVGVLERAELLVEVDVVELVEEVGADGDAARAGGVAEDVLEQLVGLGPVPAHDLLELLGLGVDDSFELGNGYRRPLPWEGDQSHVVFRSIATNFKKVIVFL